MGRPRRNSIKQVQPRLDEDDSSCSDQSLVSPSPDRLGWIPKLTMFELWSDDAEVVFDAMRELACIAESDERSIEDRSHVYEAGGPFAIVGAMNKWYEHREITIDGLRALANLGANTPFRDAVVALGGMDVILLAMVNYPECVYVQRNACAALCRLCLASKPHAAHFVGELGGLILLFAAMKTFPDNILLQKYALLSLHDFCAIEQLRVPIVRCGGVKALTQFMTKFQGKGDCDEIWGKAEATLKDLGALSDLNRVNAKRKLKATVKTIIAIQRLQYGITTKNKRRTSGRLSRKSSQSGRDLRD